MIDKALGEKLRTTREAKGITFEEASQRTRMRAALIQALENGNLAAFPNPAYAKNFLLLYGKYLGVDVSEMAGGIDTEHNVTVKNYQYLAHTKDTTQGPAKRSDFARAHSLPSWGPVIGVALIAAVGVFGSMLWLNMSRIDDTAVAPPPAKVEATSAVEQIVAPTPAQDLTPTPVVAAPAPTTAKAPVPIVAEQVEALPPQPTVTKIDGIEVRPAKVLSPVARISSSDVEVLAKIDVAEPATAPQTAPPLTDLTPLDSAEGEEESPLAKDPNTIEIEPLKKTWIVIRTSPGAAPIFEDYLYPSARAMRLPAGKYVIEARDADAIEIRKSGRAIAYTTGILRVE